MTCVYRGVFTKLKVDLSVSQTIKWVRANNNMLASLGSQQIADLQIKGNGGLRFTYFSWPFYRTLACQLLDNNETQQPQH